MRSSLVFDGTITDDFGKEFAVKLDNGVYRSRSPIR